MWLTIGLMALSAGMWCSPGRAHRRLRSADRPPTQRPITLDVTSSALLRMALCLPAGAVLGWVLAGPLAGAVGAAAGLALSGWIGRLESPERAANRAQIRRDMPLAVDLLAACVAVGRSPDQALPAVSRAVGGPLGARFDAMTARLSLGADPAAEWRRWTNDPEVSDLGRTLARSVSSGAPLAAALMRLADDRRRDRRTEAQLRARSVGVQAAGPLALCFLPAFMLIGVVPTVAGGFQHLFV